MSFNLYPNREDTSMKMRTQNQQLLVKENTQHLELETEVMAERLMELKMAMSREKEEREKTFGGGFWQSGHVGSLGSYPKEILAKSAKSGDQINRKKLTLLKDEPIVLPERNKGPGTMAIIAQRKSSNERGSSVKIKGRRCGQCEEKAAHVSCIECGEDYCASCFTAFHLRGALKKHRSMPIGPCSVRTPRPGLGRRTMDDDDYKENIGSAAEKKSEKMVTFMAAGECIRVDNNQKTSDLDNHQKSFPEGSSLLDGTYDPAENDRLFQEALMEWRKGGKVKASSDEPNPVPSKIQSSSSEVSVGTTTNAEIGVRAPIYIKFKTQSLTYAERLLLKRHRRMELGALPSAVAPGTSRTEEEDGAYSCPPTVRCHDDESAEPSGSVDGIHDDTAASVASSSSRNSSRSVEPDADARSRNDRLKSLLLKSSVNVSKMTPGSRQVASARLSSDREREKIVSSSNNRLRFNEPQISIVELTKSTSKKDVLGLERSCSYHVTEVPGNESDSYRAKPSSKRISSRPKVRRDAFTASPSESGDIGGIQPQPPPKKQPIVITQTSVETFVRPSKSPKGPARNAAVRRTTHGSSVEQAIDLQISGISLSSRGNARTTSSYLEIDETDPMKSSSDPSLQKGGDDRTSPKSANQKYEDETGSRGQIGSRVSRRPGSKNNKSTVDDIAVESELDVRFPDEGVIDTQRKSKMVARSARSRQSQRPKSQKSVKSQPGSRPSSRLLTQRDGILTKEPSEALRRVAALADPSLVTDLTTGLGSYFTIAVEVDRSTTTTPISSRVNTERQNSRWKVSNKLYQLGPRSWKPDNSLGQMVSDDQVQEFINEGLANGGEGKMMINSSSLTYEQPIERLSAEEEEISKNHNRPQTSSLEKTRGDEKNLQMKEAPILQINKMNLNSKTRVSQKDMKHETMMKLDLSDDGKIDSSDVTDRPSDQNNRNNMNSARSGLMSGRMTGRESRMIEIDGDDMSVYDDADYAEQQRLNDTEELQKMDWEVASEAGLASGKDLLSFFC